MMKNSSVEHWCATSQAATTQLGRKVSQSVRTLSNTEQDSHHTRHKEDAEGRIKTDQADRQSLRDTLDVCIDGPIGLCLSSRWYTHEH